MHLWSNYHLNLKFRLDWKRKQKINKLKLDQRLRDWNFKPKNIKIFEGLEVETKDLQRTRSGIKRPTN